jgi:hypothetical protein
MSQKLTLAVYLEQKGQKAKALKRVEAEAFGIPYPLQAGWPGRHSDMEITPEMLVHIATTPRTNSRSPAASPPGSERIVDLLCDYGVSDMLAAPKTRLPSFPGFVLRPARRRRARHCAPRT